MRIAIRARAAVCRHGCTFRVVDARIELQARCFAGDCQVDGIGCLDWPWVIEIQVLYVAAHQIRISQTRMFVLCRARRERTGFVDSFTNRFRTYVRCAGAAFALVLVDGYPQAAIIRVFEVFDIPQSRRRGQTSVAADSNFCLIHAALCRLFERTAHESFKFFSSHEVSLSGDRIKAQQK